MTIEMANRLYELRRKKGLSQEELSEKLGVSRQAVSKWERGEASPDTDNLIALASIYGVSLDELVFGKKEEDANNAPGEAGAEEENISSDDEISFINIKDKGNKVKIGPTCILVESDDGERVKIGFNGIKIENSNNDDEFDEDEDEDEDEVVIKDGHFHLEIEKPKNKVKFWLEIPYAIICTIAYLILGFYNILGGWALSWIIFITIPIYYSFVEAIYKKRFSEFSYAVLTAFIYLYLGLYQGNWHPSWIIFVTIPVYYSIANAVDKHIKSHAKNESEQ